MAICLVQHEQHKTSESQGGRSGFMDQTQVLRPDDQSSSSASNQLSKLTH